MKAREGLARLGTRKWSPGCETVTSGRRLSVTAMQVKKDPWMRKSSIICLLAPSISYRIIADWTVRRCSLDKHRLKL
jgi:hypothetical protein